MSTQYLEAYLSYQRKKRPAKFAFLPCKAKYFLTILRFMKFLYSIFIISGTWNGSDVAVKAFNTREEESFKREKDIYGQILLRHDNILVYYGHDCTSVNSTTQQWIVTQYHPLGSLYDYLNRPEVQSLSCETAFKLIFTALKGLVHLHSEVRATQEKPSIAHRDIKSKNILIRGTSESELSCVLADFGLAVTDNELPYLTFTENTNTRVGTKRYMSPEVLDLR